VITALLALVFLTQPITAIQVAAIIVVCGSVVVEFLWPRLVALRSGAGARSGPCRDTNN
jgi:hypothetical protein